MASLIWFLLGLTILVCVMAGAYYLWIRYIRPPMPGDYIASFDDWLCLWVFIAAPAVIYLGGHALGY